MHVVTLLNRVHPIKGWTYSSVRLVSSRSKDCIEVEVIPFRRNRPICSVCGKPGPIYDHGGNVQRRFRFIPILAVAVMLLYTMRRVDCKTCGRVLVEKVPWSDGKSDLCNALKSFLATWAKRMSWKDVARAFHVGWDAVYTSVEWVVEYGRQHVDLSGITAIGVDELSRCKGHKYVSLVYQINDGIKRLLWIGFERKASTLNSFFDWFGADRSRMIKFVCSDMWKPYMNVIKMRATNAINILDRFHIVNNLGKVIDKIRCQEVSWLRMRGHPAYLKKMRWILLKKPRNLKKSERDKRDKLIMRSNLRSVRAYLFRLDFEHVWCYKIASHAGAFLDQWCRRVMRSRIEPLKKYAKSIRKHRALLLNYFDAAKIFSSGIIEGLNNKARVGLRRAYGIRGKKVLELVLYHQLGALPEPPVTHRFAG
jgi:transposase